MSLILAVPDAHTHPGHSNDRFRNLGALIADRRPDCIISLGDFMSCESMSRHDLDSPGIMEGKRLTSDFSAANEALDFMMTPLLQLQSRQRSWKQKLYQPRLIHCIGNHEDWIRQAYLKQPALQGMLDIPRHLNLSGRGFEVIPWKEHVVVDEVAFCHAPINSAGKPVSGKMAVHRAAELTSMSMVFGHTHRKETVAVQRVGTGDIIQVTTAGCFYEQTPDYAKGSQENVWRGVLFLHTFGAGRYDIEELSLERLMSMY